MTAKITKILRRPSYRGGEMFYVFLKDLNGENKSYRTCLSSEFGNFTRWQGAIAQFYGGKETILDNLILRNKEVVDADSMIKII